jgi:hypothetical protein
MKPVYFLNKCINYLLDQEADSYEEYLTDEFPEIDPEDYYDVDVYSREDLNHIYAYALQARDYLIENPIYELGT